MFERFNETARRVIFFARYEAGEWGSEYIKPEHLLMGLLQEARPLLTALLLPGPGMDDLRHSLEGSLKRGEKVAISVDLPVSHSTKRTLAYGAEEAERLGNKNIGPEHILLGILREDESSAAKLLTRQGLSIDELRRKIALGSVAVKGDVLGELRSQFGPLTLRLTPEIEPATIFSLQQERTK